MSAAHDHAAWLLLIERAGKGDREAQAQLAQHAHDALADGDTSMVTAALIFSRMAAAHGQASDLGRLCKVLGLVAGVVENAGDQDRANLLGAEAVAQTELARERGTDTGEAIDTMLPHLIDALPPEIVEMAKVIRKEML